MNVRTARFFASEMKTECKKHTAPSFTKSERHRGVFDQTHAQLSEGSTFAGSRVRPQNPMKCG